MTCPVTANGPGGPHCECDNVINQGSSSGCKLMPRLYVDLVVQDFNEELLAIGFEEAETGTASGKIPKTRKQTTRTPESSPGRTRRTAGDLPAGEADRNTHFRIWLRAFGAVARSAGGARKESSAAHREQSDRGHGKDPECSDASLAWRLLSHAAEVRGLNQGIRGRAEIRGQEREDS